MKSSDYIAEFFAKENFEFVYIFQGGAISHVIDSCWKYNNTNKNHLKPICVLHEQAGSMAMDGYARVSGKPGLMLVTSGPGATNLLTGIGCSFYDSIPGIYITGQVRTWEMAGDSKQRQLGFQETDIVSMAKPITKYAVTITDARDIKYELEKALWLAVNDRPGPVLIDIPMDLQWEELDFDSMRSYIPSQVKQYKSDELNNISDVVDLLHESKMPTILCGGGVRLSEAMDQLKELVELLEIPVLTSFGGNDSFDHDSKHYSGLIGTMGGKTANEALNDSDLLLVIGSRLSWRQVRSKPTEFAKNAKIVHVDIDREELNQRVKSTISFSCDAKEFINALLINLRNRPKLSFSGWSQKCRKKFIDHPFCKAEYFDKGNPVHPYVFMQTLSKCLSDNDTLVLDAGQNVMWGMQTVHPRGKQRLLTAWGHSPMGYSLPAAMGVAAYQAGKENNTICTIGDGGFQVNIQELQTIKYYDLPVKIFIMNNHSFGAIKDYQDGNLDSRYFGTVPEYGYEAPDFIKIVEAYGIKTKVINSHDELSKNICDVLSYEGPIVCDVDLGNDTFVVLDPA